ncbi:methionine-R-sulfoxide reductase B1b isoform X2 [Conger conger]|uniref:methionine-R-sulfoxide reductase B1b isoform X2 n=1 Tax=Conger conger TaxID=82655 RepID=UPI002A5A4B72|nr:methionine-R-sulfoxide reductase B1b isoform X2 [Conger conger]
MSFCSFLGGEEFKDHFKPGIYVCASCGHKLFSSRSKFEHSSPWPAFTETIREDSVTKRPVWKVWEWTGARIPQRRANGGNVSLLNIQQLAEVCP